MDPEISAGMSLGGIAVVKVPLCKLPDTLALPSGNARSAVLGLVAAVQLPERCAQIFGQPEIQRSRPF